MVTGSLVDKDVLCNAWELSLSWEQIAETQPTTGNAAELKVGGYFVDLEAERDSYRERCKELESRLDVYYGNAYDVVVDENAKLISRIAELEKKLKARDEMTCFPDEVDWNKMEITKEMLDYLRDVYCMHPMVLDTLDYIASLEARIVELENKLAKKEIEYTDLWDDALELQARVEELEKRIAKAKELLEDEICEWGATENFYLPDHFLQLRHALDVLDGGGE